MPWTSALVWGCQHIPFTDKKYEEWIIKQIEERNPDIIVINGDLFDQAGMSKYAKFNVPTLEEEYKAANEFIGKLNELHDPSTKRSVMLMGNHCSRCCREEFGVMGSLLDYRKHVTEFKHWDTSRQYRQRTKDTFQLGQATIYHGFAVSKAGIRR